MSQTKAQLINAVDGSIVDADIVGLTSSKLSGTLPAVSAANLTNIPAANLTGALPAISGASLTGISATVKQIKSANFTSQFAHNANAGTGFISTNITVDITPTSASNKILVISGFNIWKSGDSAQCNITLYRDSTNLGGSFYGFGEFGINASYALQWNLKYNDSPNTTSQVTYNVRARIQSGHHYNMGVNNVPTNITAIEYVP